MGGTTMQSALTPKQLETYHARGYLKGFRIFDAEGVSTLQAFLARGVDEYRHNPPGVPPTGYDAPTGMME
jgi:hypothetical protein